MNVYFLFSLNYYNKKQLEWFKKCSYVTDFYHLTDSFNGLTSLCACTNNIKVINAVVYTEYYSKSNDL